MLKTVPGFGIFGPRERDVRLAGIFTGAVAILAALGAQPTQARKAVPEKRQERPARLADGQLLIVITLATQRVAVYADGALAIRSHVATGVPGHPTPTGIFSVIGKERYHASNIYSGAPMPFMQRITWSGIALHQGVVPGGRPASHGCIRLTPDFAHLLYGATKLGARVIIAQNEVQPTDFAHPFLSALNPAPPAQAERAAATKTAEAEAVTAIDAVTVSEPDPLARELDAQESKKELVQANGPISIFISAKEKKLFVRRQFLPVFESQVSIRDGERPIGTHVFTALSTANPARLRWLAVSVPDNLKPKTSGKEGRKGRDMGDVRDDDRPSTAAEALDRIDVPAELRARLEQMMSAGASVIVSDRGLGDETGEGTDFVVLTR
jgi:hypothetical protein